MRNTVVVIGMVIAMIGLGIIGYASTLTKPILFDHGNGSLQSLQGMVQAVRNFNYELYIQARTTQLGIGVFAVGALINMATQIRRHD